MKIRTDLLGELQVPRIIVDDWKKQKPGIDLEEFISETIFDYLAEYETKFAPKELAVFLRDYVISSVSQGGYSFNREYSFEDAGSRYTVLTFGFNDDENRLHTHVVGYKA